MAMLADMTAQHYKSFLDLGNQIEMKHILPCLTRLDVNHTCTDFHPTYPLVLQTKMIPKLIPKHLRQVDLNVENNEIFPPSKYSHGTLKSPLPHHDHADIIIIPLTGAIGHSAGSISMATG